MKFFFFHLMPYRPLDLAQNDNYRSSWTFRPNSAYDPAKGADEYESFIDQLVSGEALGFDGIAVNEHHQTAYGIMPAPNLIAAMLIQRTKRVKVAVLGRALPLVNNPVHIAEEFAMLDTLSRGRLITGFVRGIGAEYHASPVNPVFSHERFHEAHDLIVRAWTETGPFMFEGKHFTLPHVNLWPRPFQQPHPPIWIPSQGSSETIEWASHPDRKYPFLVTFSPEEAVVKYLSLYQEQARRYGYTATSAQLGWAAPIYVADTDERAQAEAREGVETLFNKFLPMPMEMLMPPGYTARASIKAFMKMRAGMITQTQSLELLMERGTVVVGSPKTVRAKLEQMRDRTNLGTIMALLQFGTLSDELTKRNAEMFASEVMPHLRDDVHQVPAAAE